MSTKITTGKVRLSYANVWEPKAISDGDEPKYSVSLIIRKDDKNTLERYEKALKAATEQGKASKWNGKMPPASKFKTPLRDGDEERPEDPNYKNSYFLNASSKSKPQIVDLELNPIIDKEEVYSGCFGRASITLYPFNTNGNMGVAVGLNHLQKVSDGDHLDGRTSADDDFNDGFEDEDLF